MPLNPPNLEALVKALTAESARFVVIDGFALVLHVAAPPPWIRTSLSRPNPRMSQASYEHFPRFSRKHGIGMKAPPLSGMSDRFTDQT